MLIIIDITENYVICYRKIDRFNTEYREYCFSIYLQRKPVIYLHL